MIVLDITEPATQSEAASALSLSSTDLSPMLTRYTAQNSASVSWSVQATGSPTHYAISPTLPAGLDLDPVTGTITGIATAITNETTYTITATREGAQAQFSFLLETVNFEVNSTADTGDAVLNSTCDDGTGDCTLRAAIQEAQDIPGTQKIFIPLAVTIGAGGVLSISEGTHVYGDPFSSNDEISGDNTHRIFSISATNPVTLRHLVLKDGNSAGDGGCIAASNVTLHIYDSRFERCNSGTAGGALRITHTNSILDLKRSQFINNSASYGGALEIYLGVTATLEDIHFEDNTSANGGGAIEFIGDGLTLTRSSFITNTATGIGGAISIHPSATGTIEITDSFFDGNIGLRGSAAYISAATTILRSTLYENSATDPSIGQGFGAITTTAALSFGNNHVYGNFDGAFSNFCKIMGAGSFTSLGGNVGDFSAMDTTYCTFHGSDITASAPSEARETSAKGVVYRPLQDGSGVVNSGLAGSCGTVDLLGNPRPSGGGCDAGAIEAQD